MEIGSFYEIDSQIISGALPRCDGFCLDGVERYGKRNTVFTASAREAVRLALKSMGGRRSNAKRRCLMPAYMCDSVFLPFFLEGWELVFYHLDRNLKPDFEEFAQQTERVRPELIFIHSYYGADTWKDARGLLAKWRRAGIKVMEDVTQSYYLSSAGQEADYIIGSLRKWYAIPDGAFVAADGPLSCGCISESDAFASEKLEVMQEKWKYLNEGGQNKDNKAKFLQKNRRLEEELDSVGEIRKMSLASEILLSRTEEAKAQRKRRENAEFLKNRIFEDSGISFAPSGGAPLYLPVYAKDRDQVQAFLAQRGIYAPTLWPVGAANREILDEDEKYIYSRILALPIDFRYGGQEMRYIADTLNQWRDQNWNRS